MPSAALITFQATLFALTAWKFLQALKAGWGRIPVIQLVIRDGLGLFPPIWCVAFASPYISHHKVIALPSSVLIVEAIVYSSAPGELSEVLYGYARSTHCR